MTPVTAGAQTKREKDLLQENKDFTSFFFKNLVGLLECSNTFPFSARSVSASFRTTMSTRRI